MFKNNNNSFTNREEMQIQGLAEEFPSKRWSLLTFTVLLFE